MPASTGIGHEPPSTLGEAVERRRGRRRSGVIANFAPAASFCRKRSASSSRSSAVGLTATPTKNDVGASIGRPLKSSPRFRRADQARQPDRVDLVDAARARVVADLGRVAGDREHVAHAFGVRAQQQRLEPEHGRVARRQVRDRLEPAGALDRAGDHQRADPGASGRVVVHVHELHEAGALERLGDLEQPAARAAERRVELHRDHELAFAPSARASRVSRMSSPRATTAPRLGDLEAETRAARALVDRRADRRDLGRASSRSSRRSRARRDRARARRTRRSTRASRADRSPVRPAGSRGRCSGAPRARGRSACICSSATERREQAGAVICADRGDAELGEPRCGLRPPSRRRASRRPRRRSSARRSAATRPRGRRAIASASSSRS